MPGTAVVTGAHSYIGAATAAELVRRGWNVRTLTNRPPRLGSPSYPGAPLLFDPAHLVRSLRGAALLVDTYWIRLPRGRTTFATAVANSGTLIEAARDAGVGRIVHVSVTNASPDDPLGYYRGKAEVDALVRGSKLPHAIVRPTLVVGPNDVLTSNIAWFLRRFPLFPLPGGGAYRLQPVTLSDCARVIADAAEAGEDLDLDAAGPRTPTFAEYVAWVARACGVAPRCISAPGWLTLAALRAFSLVLGDTVLAREELLGLAGARLVSRRPPLGIESVEETLERLGPSLGRRYVNDRDRHFGKGAACPL